jgi:hypothetical protein
MSLRFSCSGTTRNLTLNAAGTFRLTSLKQQSLPRFLSTSRTVSQKQALSRPLHCHVGVSYASKDSPPFATREEADKSASKGFQNGPIARWKDQMLGMGTLRTELLKTTSDPEGKELSDVEQAKQLEAVIQDRKRWGAGEDFFFVRQGVRVVGIFSVHG